MKKCLIKGCQKKYYAKGYCQKHYARLQQFGNPNHRTIFEFNEIICKKNVCEILLYNHKNQEIARTIIDKKYLNKVRNKKWRVNYGYVLNKKQMLHHLILPRKNGLMIDHIDRNKLNNCKNNLRYATRSQNGMNRRNTKGYNWNKINKKWQAYIVLNKKLIFLGVFNNKNEAKIARKNAELKYFGKFSPRFEIK